MRLSLLDPHRAFAAYSLPQGNGNFGQVDLHQPAFGTWTAIVWTSASAAGISGPVQLRTTDFQASSAGSVSPSSFTLSQGASRTVTVRATAPANEASADSLLFTGRFGQATTVPVITRAVQRVSAGRAGPVQRHVQQRQPGATDLDVNHSVPGASANGIAAHLSDPSGEPVANDLNQRPSGNATGTDRHRDDHDLQHQPAAAELLRRPELGRLGDIHAGGGRRQDE